MLAAEFQSLWRAIREIFSARNLRWHVLAITLTVVISLSGLDWLFYESTRAQSLYPLVMLAGLGGFVLPVALPIVLLAIGAMRRDRSLMSLALSLAKATLLGLLLSFLYKTFTGRAHPEVFGAGLTDLTRDFQFGILKRGVFWGWPSSHTTVAFASSVALYQLTQNRTMRIAAIAWAAVVALGAAVGFHWFSDVLAGGIFGTIVGLAVVRVQSK